jgi:hypothetical protein
MRLFLRAFAVISVLVFAIVCISSIPQRARSADAYQKGIATFTVVVDAAGNVFGAGVGGVKANGGGKKPTVLQLNNMRNGVAWFPSVLGKVSCCGNSPGTFNGPEGGNNAGGTTDIQSSGGISGVFDQKRTMFLVGVFVGYPGPSAPGPERLDVTYASGKQDIYPKLDQTFYIGTGKVLSGGSTYQKYHIPQGANRLVLGFADSQGFHGTPGAYDDNFGHLDVKVMAGPQY